MNFRVSVAVLALTLVAAGSRGGELPADNPRTLNRGGRFTIQFEGLMTHIGTPAEKTHVAVLAAHGHQALLEVAGQHRVGSRTDLKMELRDGDVVSFDLPDGEASVGADFRAAVPHLSSLIRGGTVREPVRRALPDESVAAYVAYPAGSLSVIDTFAHPAEYRFIDGEFAAKHCAANRVLSAPSQNGALSRLPYCEMVTPSLNGSVVVQGCASVTGRWLRPPAHISPCISR